ncbi:MAG: LacI family DNA-binding transcriptional regulator [Bacteroidales bacterium]|jgi:DNA-binding LacI/PurR family transcriptional regulator|nr:LacI family DNA-binding transcriptional regulator [Bacteroidales bacterium]
MIKSSKITIHDLAKELNTTPATVSRALNDNPRISQKTKERVKALALKHNYQPNIVASNFRKGKSKTIGVMVPNINRHYFSNAIHSIETELAKADYNVMICQTSDSPEVEEKLINTLINHQVSGIIISSNKRSIDTAPLQRALDSGIKVVQFDNILSNIKTSTVHNNDFEASKAIVLHMLNQGFRRIALFCGLLTSNIYQDRKGGYLAAHKEFGIEAIEDLFFYSTNTREEGEKSAQRLLDEKYDIDAIFSTGDYAALGASLVLKKAGIRIPEDIGIAGYANEPFTEFMSPPITSFDQNSQEIGRIAAIQILKEIKNIAPPFFNTVVQGNMILRASTIRKK